MLPIPQVSLLEYFWLCVHLCSSLRDKTWTPVWGTHREMCLCLCSCEYFCPCVSLHVCMKEQVYIYKMSPCVSDKRRLALCSPGLCICRCVFEALWTFVRKKSVWKRKWCGDRWRHTQRMLSFSPKQRHGAPWTLALVHHLNNSTMKSLWVRDEMVPE